jgi:hypothetical protein
VKTRSNAFFYLVLVASSLFFLGLELVTHVEFFLHLAALPLEALVVIFIIERLLAREEAGKRRRLLMYIKSTMFRSEMRSLFIANFAALKSPRISMDMIRTATLDELRHMRRQADHIEYKSVRAMEPVVLEYVKARAVWLTYMNRAIEFNFEDIFNNMIFILHFISDVEAFKEHNPRKLFVEDAQAREPLMGKTRKVLEDGIKAFLDYAVELKDKQPDVFLEMMSDYQQSARLRGR